MKTVVGMFLLFGMSPGSFLPSFLTDQMLAPLVVRVEKKTDSHPSGSEKKPESAQLVARTYAATRPTSSQVAQHQLRELLSLKIQPVERLHLCLATPAGSDGAMMAIAQETGFRVQLEPACTLPSIRALAPPRRA